MIERPQRKKMRLKEYDYSSNGAYFITICVKNKQKLLGYIDVGRSTTNPGSPNSPIILSQYGKTFIKTIEFINEKNNQLTIDKYVIMPNHVHLIAMIDDLDTDVGIHTMGTGMPRRINEIIPKLISSIKRFTNKQAGFDLWQTSYHDHIIRDEEDYQTHLRYIEENPIKWTDDEYFIRL